MQLTASWICLSRVALCYVIIVNDWDTRDPFVHCQLKLNSPVSCRFIPSLPRFPATTPEHMLAATRADGSVSLVTDATPVSMAGIRLRRCTAQVQLQVSRFSSGLLSQSVVSSASTFRRTDLVCETWLNWCRQRNAAVLSATAGRLSFHQCWHQNIRGTATVKRQTGLVSGDLGGWISGDRE